MNIARCAWIIQYNSYGSSREKSVKAITSLIYEMFFYVIIVNCKLNVFHYCTVSDLKISKSVIFKWLHIIATWKLEMFTLKLYYYYNKQKLKLNKFFVTWYKRQMIWLIENKSHICSNYNSDRSNRIQTAVYSNNSN